MRLFSDRVGEELKKDATASSQTSGGGRGVNSGNDASSSSGSSAHSSRPKGMGEVLFFDGHAQGLAMD